MNNDTLKFKISSALKSVIGKDLITDDLIAIFELVKNSYDAHATQVKLKFINIYDPDKVSTIIIEDDGKGMSYNDILEKWLFVAYSAKQNGTEDNNYRNKIKRKRHFAGAKGIGRFSCDRLGAMLKLTTITENTHSYAEILDINWGDFENDSKKEFIEIDVKHTRSNKTLYPFRHGTSLEISNLRSTWDRSKLNKLKRSLEKLICPEEINNTDNFSITIDVLEELEKDESAYSEQEIINGPIKNRVFEYLNLKTTQVITTVDATGNFITTELTDRGTFIYKIKERNDYKMLADIKYTLFYLNQAAKTNFTRIMGITPISYGSVFLYKNGFRVYPFGEEGEDRLGIDRRKQQGYARNLGTREIMGRIEINSTNNDFKETSSRDGGLIRTKSYDELLDCFMNKTLKRLERYVVDVQWPIKDEFDTLRPETIENSQEAIFNLISLLTSSKSIVDFTYNSNILDILHNKHDKSLPRIAQNFKRIAGEINNPILYKIAKIAEKQAIKLLSAKDEAEKEVIKKEKELKEKEEALILEYNNSLFLQTAIHSDTKAIISMQHHIDHATERISRSLDSMKDAILTKAKPERLLDYIDTISLENKKISTLARFVTKANFNLMSNSINNDLAKFVKEYIQVVYKNYTDLQINNTLLDAEIEMDKNISFLYRFMPLEMVIVLDNLLDNSLKAGAKIVKICIDKPSEKQLIISFKDDGKGVDKKYINRIFEFGFTTTNGSGLGLYHSKKLIEKMKGTIILNEDCSKGAEFILEFKNENKL